MSATATESPAGPHAAKEAAPKRKRAANPKAAEDGDAGAARLPVRHYDSSSAAIPLAPGSG